MLIAENDSGAAIGFVQLYPTFSSILATPMYVLSDLFVVSRQGGEVLELDYSILLPGLLVPLVQFGWS